MVITLQLWWFLRQIAAVRQNDYYEFKPMYVCQIPIGTDSETEQIDAIVDWILSITKAENYLQDPQKQAKVKTLEREIDRMVYQLYGLTPDEIKIVEGENK